MVMNDFLLLHLLYSKCFLGITNDGKEVLFEEILRTKGKTILEVSQQLARFCIGRQDDTYFVRDIDLKRKLQAALHVVNAESAWLVCVYSLQDMVCIHVQKEDGWWAENKDKVEVFRFNCFKHKH